MSDCKGGCGGCCGSCGGCSQAMVLSPEEVDILWQLAQIPFLPVARRADSDEPRCFEEGVTALALQCLEKRGLISIDYDKPLRGGYSALYDPYPVRGSFALTARGQQVLELMQIHGVE
ncbi:MAG: hypothetical protein E7470_03420 [Ruminococcaceae bacterium]|nr:hypothetical protein [Oscillospiraceae bacterium]